MTKHLTTGSSTEPSVKCSSLSVLHLAGRYHKNIVHPLEWFLKMCLQPEMAEMGMTFKKYSACFVVFALKTTLRGEWVKRGKLGSFRIITRFATRMRGFIHISLEDRGARGHHRRG